MRKYLFLFIIVIIMTAIVLSVTGADAMQLDIPMPILYTYYRQMGWGDRIQIGFIDEDGGIWTLSGYDSELKWPYKPEEQLAYLSAKRMKFTQETKLEHDDVFSIKSLVYDVEDQGSKSVPAANDAGTEKSYAVRYSRDKDPEFILLGMSGDDAFENLDPDAQALYLVLRQMFPNVTSYAGLMGPVGFTPVPLAEFIGIDPYRVENAELRAYYNDCEEGNIPLEVSDQDKAELLYLLRNGKVTGKADNVESTGGYHIFSFYDPDGSYICSISFYEGHLATRDGNWYFSKE